MIIYCATSRLQKILKREDISFDEFMKRCATPVRTRETVEEFEAMPKDQRDQIKDVGGFILGELKDGWRRANDVISRNCLTFDLDKAKPGMWDRIILFYDFKCFMYSTHHHTDKTPRFRLIVALSRPVLPDEYEAISRMVGNDIGLEMMDHTCHQPARMMYFPSVPSDGQFFFESQDGPCLDVDEVLSRYNNWRDASKWPCSADENKKLHDSAKKQADPLTKKGIIGAYCRTYDIRTVIDTFLNDVYQPSAEEGRYDYIPAESSAGLVIYEGKFAYSFHASDPASGKLLNAFDLVRIHKFGDLDDKKKEDTAPAKLPSFKVMCDYAMKDENVRLTLAKDNLSDSAEGFSDLEEDNSWMAELEMDDKGEFKSSLNNFVLILRNDVGLQSISYNEHYEGVNIRDAEGLPWNQLKPGWGEHDFVALASYIDSIYHIYSKDKLNTAILTVAAERRYHPIKEYLETLPAWDGVERLDTLLIDYLGAEDISYVRSVTRKTLVAAVARIYEPGRKFDTILILVGEQGVGKSTFFERIAEGYYSDSLSINDMHDKTAAEKLLGYWIIEISEMNGLKKVDVETVKGFISRKVDRFRAAYGMRVEEHPRQCIIVGSTNASEGFLRDITGNRRFWPVYLFKTNTKHSWDISEEVAKQIWSEALYRYEQGEDLVLSREDQLMALNMQRKAMEHDDREGLVRNYLETLLPEDWNGMSLSDRRMYIMGDDFITGNRPGVHKRDKVCNMEIWSEAFCREPSSMRKQDSYEISAIMNKIEGWEKYSQNRSGKLSFGIYGPQIAYVRTENDESSPA